MLSQQFEFTVRAFTAIAVCVSIIPAIGLALIPVFAMYGYYGNLFRASSREIRRSVCNESRSHLRLSPRIQRGHAHYFSVAFFLIYLGELWVGIAALWALFKVLT